MITRRQFVTRTTATLVAALGAPSLRAQGALETRLVPGTGERLPVIGMGSSRTFDTDLDAASRALLKEVLAIFFEAGGTLVDSSPMYGRAESVLGELLAETPGHERMFAATKVWTDGRDAGIGQMQRSMQRMRVTRFDLMQIHNLRDWRTHLETLIRWKREGRIRYLGITTSHGRDHEPLERLLREHAFDFVQLSYNIEDRQAERRLLPLAAERGIAVIVNRPFQRGSLFRRVRDVPLPAWRVEYGIQSWGQFFLKYAASHPAVTCVIPATSKPKHMRDNMGACIGPLPDAAGRARMEQFMSAL